MSYEIILPLHVLESIEVATGYDAGSVITGKDNFRGYTELFVGSEYIGCYDAENQRFVDDRGKPNYPEAR